MWKLVEIPVTNTTLFFHYLNYYDYKINFPLTIVGTLRYKPEGRGFDS